MDQKCIKMDQKCKKMDQKCTKMDQTIKNDSCFIEQTVQCCASPVSSVGRDRSDSAGCGEIVGIAENPANNPHYTNKHVKEAG